MEGLVGEGGEQTRPRAERRVDGRARDAGRRRDLADAEFETPVGQDGGARGLKDLAAGLRRGFGARSLDIWTCHAADCT